MLKNFGGRKYSIVIFVLLCAVAAVVTDATIDPPLLEFVKWVIGLYFAGNVGRAAVDKITTKGGA
jgi:hypothetical protein